MKEFLTAARHESPVENDVDIDFRIGDDIYTASAPTSGQLTVFMATQGGTGATPSDAAKAMLELLWGILGQEQYVHFENGMKNGSIDVETVTEIIEYLIEEWSARPTPPASDSLQQQERTGRPSTVRRLAEESTHSG